MTEKVNHSLPASQRSVEERASKDMNEGGCGEEEDKRLPDLDPFQPKSRDLIFENA